MTDYLAWNFDHGTKPEVPCMVITSDNHSALDICSFSNLEHPWKIFSASDRLKTERLRQVR